MAQWTWKSKGTLFGLHSCGDTVVAISKWESSESSGGALYVHHLDAATGKVTAVRRLHGCQWGTDGRYHLDIQQRLVRVGRGDGPSAAIQMFLIR